MIAGADTLTGSLGSDTFQFAVTGNGIDRITDFALEARIVLVNGGITTPSIDTNYSAGAEIQIQLDGSFSASQFRLDRPAAGQPYAGQTVIALNQAPALVPPLADQTVNSHQAPSSSFTKTSFTDAEGGSLTYIATEARIPSINPLVHGLNFRL